MARDISENIDFLIRDIKNHFLYSSLLTIAALLIFGVVITKVILFFTDKLLQKSDFDPALYRFGHNMVKILCYLVIALMVLDAMGINTTSLVTMVGLTGAAIALSLKDSLSNVAGGIILLITRPFKQGDYVEIDNTSGVVQHIDLLLTTLKTFDNKVVRVPNGKISVAVITNHSESTTRRVDCRFGIGYEDDMDLARQLILEVVEACPMILKEPAPFVGVVDNASSSVLIEAKVWTDTDNYWNVKYYLNEEVKKVFDARGINIPYNQLDVHIKN